MLVKSVIVFLLIMVLVALVGRALFPGKLRLGRRCPTCGAAFRPGHDCRAKGRA
jgi:hypothetical protein